MQKLSFETPEFLKLVNDPKFRQEFEKQTSAQGIKDLFSKNGVKMTDEDLAEFAAAIKAANDNSVSEDFLAHVAGGGKGLGDFINDHPYLTFFAVTGIVGTLCQTVAVVAASKK